MKKKEPKVWFKPNFQGYLSAYMSQELADEVRYFAKVDKMRSSQFIRLALTAYVKRYQKIYGNPEERKQMELKGD